MNVHEPLSKDLLGCTPYRELQKLDDERLMEELQAGNADAFAVIFKRYYRLIHVTALRILRDANEAEDLTQSLFLEIYRVAGQFDPVRGTLKVWLLQYAYHRSISHRNYLAVRQFYNQVDIGEVEDVASFWLQPVRMSRQETTTLSREALTALPAKQRKTIEMVFFEGLSFKEIAQMTSDTFSNVRHHYYRGLEKLRSHLDVNGRGENLKCAAPSFGEEKRVASRAL